MRRTPITATVPAPSMFANAAVQYATLGSKSIARGAYRRMAGIYAGDAKVRGYPRVAVELWGVSIMAVARSLFVGISCAALAAFLLPGPARADSNGVPPVEGTWSGKLTDVYWDQTSAGSLR